MVDKVVEKAIIHRLNDSIATVTILKGIKASTKKKKTLGYTTLSTETACDQ